MARVTDKRKQCRQWPLTMEGWEEKYSQYLVVESKWDCLLRRVIQSIENDGTDPILCQKPLESTSQKALNNGIVSRVFRGPPKPVPKSAPVCMQVIHWV